MKLFIDTTSNTKTIVCLGDQIAEKDSRLWHSQAVLPMIEQLLSDQKMKLTDLTEIEVKTGEGSYTGIRVGVAIAQALGLALKVPVTLTSPIL
jgi:tRNA threonylcarbamoyladenosine biosynthesis protein TsaB